MTVTPRGINTALGRIQLPQQQTLQHVRRTNEGDPIMGHALLLTIATITDFLEDYCWIARAAMTDQKNSSLLYQCCHEAGRSHERVRTHRIIFGVEELRGRSSEDQMRLYLEILAEQLSESE